jgi:hypothetical protein
VYLIVLVLSLSFHVETLSSVVRLYGHPLAEAAQLPDSLNQKSIASRQRSAG